MRSRRAGPRRAEHGLCLHHARRPPFCQAHPGPADHLGLEPDRASDDPRRCRTEEVRRPTSRGARRSRGTSRARSSSSRPSTTRPRAPGRPRWSRQHRAPTTRSASGPTSARPDLTRGAPPAFSCKTWRQRPVTRPLGRSRCRDGVVGHDQRVRPTIVCATALPALLRPARVVTLRDLQAAGGRGGARRSALVPVARSSGLTGWCGAHRFRPGRALQGGAMAGAAPAPGPDPARGDVEGPAPGRRPG